MGRSVAQVNYESRPLGNWRVVMSDMLRVAKEKNIIHGLYEVDVTEARRRIHEYKARSHADFSFTAFLIGCIALAVGENKSVQALRQGKRLIIFDDVDINIQIEYEVNGEKVVSAYVVRAANRKSARQIHDEIRAAQQKNVSAKAPVTGFSRWIAPAAHLPGFLRRMILRRILNNPFLIRDLGGTVNLTSIGMFGKGGGWGIAISETGLAVTVGGIEEVVKYINGQFRVREMLSITLGFDHDVIDGAPSARFSARMKALIEAGYGLESFDSLSAPIPDKFVKA